MNSRPDLSVCMIVKNEEQNLAGCLASIRDVADEIVVVDTGSIDRTKEIALGFTPDVFDFEWIDDFAAARNRSLSLARGRYAMWLDADDRVPRESLRQLHDMKTQLEGDKAFYFILENVHAGRPATQWLQLRCVPLRPDIRFEGRIHEQLFPSVQRLGLPLIALDVLIRHEGYTDREACVVKMYRNLEILEDELRSGRNDPDLLFFLARTYLGLGKEPEAIDALHRTIQGMEQLGYNSQTLVECRLQLAKVLEHRGDKPAALRVFLKAAALAGDCTQHLYQLALLAQSLDRHVEAADLLCRLKEMKHAPYLYPSEKVPPREELCVLAAYSLLCVNRRDRAAEQLGEAWNLGLDACKSWEMMGLKAAGAGRADMALACLETAERNGRMSSDGYCGLGAIRQDRGLADGAEHCYKTALALDPDHRDSSLRLGKLLQQRGDLQGARQLLHHLVESSGNDLDALLELARIASNEGDREEFDRLRARIREQIPSQDAAPNGEGNPCATPKPTVKPLAEPKRRMAEIAAGMIRSKASYPGKDNA